MMNFAEIKDLMLEVVRSCDLHGVTLEDYYLQSSTNGWVDIYKYSFKSDNKMYKIVAKHDTISKTVEVKIWHGFFRVITHTKQYI